jgi:uncharacterized Zn finger protein
MLKLQRDKMTNAIARAKQVHPRVRVIDAANRVYAVSGSNGGEYAVKFHVINGEKFSECDCAAGRKAQMCYHVASAAVVNIAVQSMRQQNPTPAESQAFLSQNIGWSL